MNVYEIVTEQVVAALEQGTAPWRKPWVSRTAPRNLRSGKPYRGINVWLLTMRPFASPYWLTYRQAQELGGVVRKGERATLVVFWRILRTLAQEGEGTKDKKVPLLRYYNVFNAEQCDGITVPAAEESAVFAPIDAAEEIVRNLPAEAPPIEHGGDMACYLPCVDRIRVPERASFTDAEEYYSTLFHELTHASGHPSRLDRPDVMSPSFGSARYSREELIAEMGSAFLCHRAGILVATLDNSAAYLRRWAGAIKADSRMVVTAAAAAQGRGMGSRRAARPGRGGAYGGRREGGPGRWGTGSPPVGRT